MRLSPLVWAPFLVATCGAEELVLTAAGPTVVHEGELIRLALELRAADPTAARPSAIWSNVTFRVDPPPVCADPAPACRPHDMWTWNKTDSIVGFAHSRTRAETELNSHIAPLPRGRYRVCAILTKQEISRRPTSTEQLLSNPIAVQVIPATPAWLRSTVARLRTEIAQTGTDRDIRDGMRQLGFLYHSEAFAAGLDLYSQFAQRDLLFGLYRNPDGAQSCRLLRGGDG